MSDTQTTYNDASDGTSVTRDMTNEELAEHESAVIEIEAQNSQLQAKAAARESALAKLADLGLTAEEIAAL
jgi:hypothetical protein